MNDLISVIIPAHNHEAYVEEAIHSIIGQTYRRLELIVIDDGSTDNTWCRLSGMLEACRQRFERVHFERQKNKGVCCTLNRLVEIMRGEYAYMVASDDVALPDAITMLYSYMSARSEYGAAVGDNEIIDENSMRVCWDKMFKSVRHVKDAAYTTFGEYLRTLRPDVDFLTDDFGNYSSLLVGNYITNGLLVRRAAFAYWRFTNAAPVEDWFMVLQIAKRYKIKFLDSVLYS